MKMINSFKLMSVIFLWFCCFSMPDINAQHDAKMIEISETERVQPSKRCGEPRINFEADRLADFYLAANERQDVDQVIKIFFHICRNDDGSNAGATLQEIEEEFQDLLEDYNPGGICFAFMGVDFVDDTEINTSLNPDFQSDENMLLPHLKPDCLNIFYHADLINYGGNAYSIPNTYCSIEMGNIDLWRTISHEVGHCLGLSHTFTTGFGEGYIDGSLCLTTGDKVCDTPVDPYNDGNCFSNSDCLYTGNCTDPNGASNYAPPYSNIMSYWGSEECTVTNFTTGQYNRAKSFLMTDPGLQTVKASSSISLENINLNSGNYFFGAVWNITTQNMVWLTGSIDASMQANSVSLLPGFEARPTSGIVRVGGTDCQIQ